MAGVVFTGSTPEEIELAKKFWKSVDLLPKSQSHLIVPDISQRTETKTESSGRREKACDDAAMKKFWQEAERRKQKEGDEKFEKYEQAKFETQNLLNKRREERAKREEISKQANTNSNMYTIEPYDWEEDTTGVTEAIETIKDINAFERQLKSR
eukprot:Seg2030.8 transcript_id=Seg2030.8/GoldUCD/mRNA.D3Y31 product="UPF0722 protein" protein_id=Seg2030.8/GoldUCD/D3Y31